MDSLHEIGIKHNTDKAYLHNFCNEYEIFLKNKNIISIVEVGILNGGSLRMWADFYPDAKVVGIDNDASTLINEGNIVSCIGDQNKPKETILPRVLEVDCDLFIDDGSHLWIHQMDTFQTVFPHMKVGSVYIMEDLHTSLWAGSMYDTRTTNPLEYIKKFVENNDNVFYKFIHHNNEESLSMVIEKLAI